LESEIKNIISFIFRRSGKKKLKKTEFYLMLSIDLNWFSPNEANHFINLAVEKNLLKKINNTLEPNFEISNIKIPFGFFPNKNTFKFNNLDEVIPENDVKKIIFSKQKFDKVKQNEISNIIIKISKKKNIYQNVASLLVFIDLNVKISEYIKLAEKQIFND
jgi:hypothetical protein